MRNLVKRAIRGVPAARRPRGVSATNQYHLKTTSNAKRAKLAKNMGVF